MSHSDMHIEQMNNEPQILYVSPTKNCHHRAVYVEMINNRGPYVKALPLIADTRIYLDTGCSAAIPHGIELDWTRPYSLTDVNYTLLIMPLRASLIDLGLVIEVHPVRFGIQLFTSVFNLTNKPIIIKEGAFISALVSFNTAQQWEMK